MFAHQLKHFCTTTSSAVENVMNSNFASDPSTLAICFMASLCAILPLDISQLSFAILGAVLYALLQRPEFSSTKKKKSPPLVTSTAYNRAGAHAAKPKGSSNRSVRNDNNNGKVPESCHSPEITVSAQPIRAPEFQSQHWEGEIQELLTQITPAAAVQEIVNDLAQTIQRILRHIIPEVEVTGFASGNLIAGKAFGVAVPEVDIIASVNPQVIRARLQGRHFNGDELDVQKVQKAAVRAFTDRLVSAGGFKFRRSAFRGLEPKVTLLAPQDLGVFVESFPIDFSVNAVIPFYNAALLTECGQIDSRAKELILLVKRWAKDRGICHAAKGHLSPYMWNLLSIYFLQVGVKEEGPLLPPVGQFQMSSGLLAQSCTASNATDSASKSKWAPTGAEPQKPVGTLFKEFVHFFGTQFDSEREAVSVRLGQRAPPGVELPLHIILADDSSASQVGLSIENPFQAAHNLGDCMTAFSFARFKEELDRANTLCSKGASLTELLEPWVPAVEPKGDTEGQSNGIAELPVANAYVPPCRRHTADRNNGTVEAASVPPWRRQVRA